MKRILSLVLSIIMLLSLCACGNNDKTEKYCSSCGEGISKEVVFCEHCGAAVNNEKNESVDTSSDNSSSTESKTEETSKPSSATESTSKPTESSKPTNTSKPIDTSGKPSTLEHTHSYSAATCKEPQKCSCGAIQGDIIDHKFQSGKCIYCQLEDIIIFDENFMKNTTYVAYQSSGNGKLLVVVLNYDAEIENYLAMEYNYSTDLSEWGTEAKSIIYNGIRFYGGYGGFSGVYTVKDNTLQGFSELDMMLNNGEWISVYVMQHDKSLRLISSKWGTAPKSFEIYTGNPF